MTVEITDGAQSARDAATVAVVVRPLIVQGVRIERYTARADGRPELILGLPDPTHATSMISRVDRDDHVARAALVAAMTTFRSIHSVSGAIADAMIAMVRDCTVVDYHDLAASLQSLIDSSDRAQFYLLFVEVTMHAITLVGSTNGTRISLVRVPCSSWRAVLIDFGRVEFEGARRIIEADLDVQWLSPSSAEAQALGVAG